MNTVRDVTRIAYRLPNRQPINQTRLRTWMAPTHAGFPLQLSGYDIPRTVDDHQKTPAMWYMVLVV